MKNLPVILLAFVCFSAAATPMYEPFNYALSPTNLIGRTSPDGVTWTQNGPNASVTNQPYIESGSLTYTGLAPSQGNSVHFGGKGVSASIPLKTPIGSGTGYYSFILKITDITSLGTATGGVFFTAFTGGTFASTSEPSIIGAGLIARKIDSTHFDLGVKKAAFGAVMSGGSFNLGDTIFVVASYTIIGTPLTGGSDDQARLWINPDPATFGSNAPPTETVFSPGGGTSVDINSATLSRFCIYNRGAVAEPDSIILDELTIGTNWAEVTPNSNTVSVVTQPLSQRVLVGGTANFSATTFRAAGVKWQLNSVDIPNATNLTLSVVNAQTTGNYTLVATNLAGGSTSSSNAVLTVVPDTFPRLTQIWSAAPYVRPYLTADANTPNVRSIAYNSMSNQVLIVSRTNTVTGTTNANIFVLDASSGADLYQMNANSNLITGGTANGTIMLSSIAVADDGAVYACNIATDESVANLFKLYRWTNSSADAVPALVFQGDPAGQTTSPRWGDTLAARGSGLGTEVFVDSNDGLWAGDLYPIDGTLTNLANHSLFNQLGSGSIGRSLAFGSGESIYQKRNGAGLLLSNFDTNSGAVTIVTNYNNYSSTFGPVGFNLSSNLLCGITFATSNTVPDTLDLFEISDPSQPLYLASYPFPTNHQANANFIGQVIFSGKNVYALDANNGVAAFILTAQPPKLNISLSGSSVTLSWPSSFSGFTLQGSPLVAPTNWTDIGTGTLSGGSYTVTEGVGGTSKFYRLRN